MEARNETEMLEYAFEAWGTAMDLLNQLKLIKPVDPETSMAINETTMTGDKYISWALEQLALRMRQDDKPVKAVTAMVGGDLVEVRYIGGERWGSILKFVLNALKDYEANASIA